MSSRRIQVKKVRFNLLREGTKQNIVFRVSRMVNMGFSGRNQETVRKHIEELKKQEIQAPSIIPTVYPVSPYMATQEPIIYVQEQRNSGEAEFVLIIDDKDIYVAVGSDHTDRELEKISILKSKQICPNIVSKEAWLLQDIAAEWDEIVLRSWTKEKDVRTLYQEATLSAILSPSSLVECVKSRTIDRSSSGLMIYSGTIPVLTTEMAFASEFEVELFNPRKGNRLTCQYKIRVLDFISKP
jgi:hypothetical protein